MNRHRLRMFVFALVVIITIAWLIESFTLGRGFVSTYLAPVAIIGNLVLAFSRMRDNKK